LLCSPFLASISASVSSQFPSISHPCIHCHHSQHLFGHPFISSDIQYFLNHFFTSGEILCHYLGIVAQQFLHWYQNLVPSQEPIRIKLFQVFLKRPIH
jgi:hypothetical protein